MQLPIYQVDAFSNKPFGGNPAAVVILQNWLDDITLTQIAAENNLSETAFLLEKGPVWELRWFTPTLEINLCGHATLASAKVIWQALGRIQDVLAFETKSGLLQVRQNNGRLEMTFPAWEYTALEIPQQLIDGLQTRPLEVYQNRDTLVVLENEQAVKDVSPDFERLKALETSVIIVTAQGTSADFVSRCFGPRFGILEDPVTGSSHCTLIPFWVKRLGKTTLFSRQLSKRGGELWCELHGDKVIIAGHAVIVIQGTLNL